jgi:universal stress protein A
MSKTILLAVDAQHYAPEAAELARQLCRDTGDEIFVLHVHEFPVGDYGRLQVGCPEAEAEWLVTGIVSGFRSVGITANAEIHETNAGHVAQTILKAADEHGVRMIVLGSSGRTGLPHTPFGSVSHRLLHLARWPVLVVPRQAPPPTAEAPPTAAQSAPSRPPADRQAPTPRRPR